MVKFCETRFAQTELMVYKNFEKNYNIYRRTWGDDAEEVEPKPTLATTTSSTRATTSATATASTTINDEE